MDALGSIHVQPSHLSLCALSPTVVLYPPLQLVISKRGSFRSGFLLQHGGMIAGPLALFTGIQLGPQHQRATPATGHVCLCPSGHTGVSTCSLSWVEMGGGDCFGLMAFCMTAFGTDPRLQPPF